MMRQAIRWAFVILLVGVPAFYILPVIWPATVDYPSPSVTQGVLWMLFSLAQALLISLAMTVSGFLVFRKFFWRKRL